jgi:hypothetical protein
MVMARRAFWGRVEYVTGSVSHSFHFLSVRNDL